MSQPLLIVGASGRAAAASALRAGFDPFVIDLFADADTVRLCPTLKCDPADYPHGFIELAKRAPPGPWMYTGGLENYPEVIAEISETRPLWGNPPDALEQVRNPFRLSQLLSVKCLDHPPVLPAGSELPLGERWLRKPLRGSGGVGIWMVHASTPPEAGGHYFYQRFVEGRSMSLAFATFAPGYKLFGYTSQLVGTPWLHAPPFRYAGSIGPVPINGLDMQVVHLTAFRFGGRTNLRGLGNIDFIHDGEWSHVIEVNPRYPASVEALELAHRFASLEWHLKGFVPHRDFQPPPPASRVVGKAIYYAAVPITFPASGPWDDSLARCTDVWRVPEFADIPHPGTLVEPGQPVFTLFASAPTEAECVHQLKARAAECDRLFGLPTPEDAP